MAKMEFNEFVSIIRRGIAEGEIKLSQELTDFDLAVQFAVGRIVEKKGYPCEVTADEIYSEIMEFAPYMFSEAVKEADDG